jgi:hypothetical protein
MPLWIHLYLRHAICEHQCAPRIANVKHSQTTLAARPNQSEAHCSHGVPSGGCISSSLAASNSSRSSGMEMVLWLPMSTKPVLAAALSPPMSTARTAFAKAPARKKWEDILHAGRHQGCSHKMYHNASATWRSSRQPAHDHGHSATCLLLLTGGCMACSRPAPACSQPAGKLAGQPRLSLGLGMPLSPSQLSVGGKAMDMDSAWLDLAASRREMGSSRPGLAANHF